MPIDKVITPLGQGGGTVTGGQNIGGEEEIFKQLNGTLMEFRTLKGIGGIVVAQNGDVLEFSAPGGGAGTINDAENVGTGTGIFKQAVVDVLQFFSLEGVDDVEIALVGNNIQIGAPLIANFQPQLDSLFDGVIQLQTAVTDLDQDVVEILLAYVTGATNVGGGDAEWFSAKNGNNLEFRTLDVGGNGLSVGTVGNLVTLDLIQNLTTSGSPVFANLKGFTPYTPTLTNVTNVAASTTSDFGYCRVGNYVFGGGRITIDPTSAALATELGVSIPISSNFSLFTQCSGGAIASASASLCAAVRADTTNDRIQIVYTNTAELGSKEFMVWFFYEVI